MQASGEDPELERLQTRYSKLESLINEEKKRFAEAVKKHEEKLRQWQDSKEEVAKLVAERLAQHKQEHQAVPNGTEDSHLNGVHVKSVPDGAGFYTPNALSDSEGTFVTPSPPKRQRDDVPAYPEQQGVYYEDEANGGYVEDDEGGDYEQGESTDDQQLPYYAHKEQQPPGHLAPPPQALKLPDDLLSEGEGQEYDEETEEDHCDGKYDPEEDDEGEEADAEGYENEEEAGEEEGDENDEERYERKVEEGSHENVPAEPDQEIQERLPLDVNYVPTFLPRQVALKQQQQHAPEMPPGFSPGSPPAPPRPSVAAKGPPPGFAAAGAAAGPPPGMGTLPGFPRSRTQESRGAAELSHNQLQNLLLRRPGNSARPRSDGSAESQEASAAAPKLPQPQQQQPQQQRLDARMLINQRRAAASANGATAPAAAARPLNMDQLFPRPRAEAVTRGADRDPPVRGVSPHNIKQLMPRPPSMGRAASEEPSAPVAAARPKGNREWDIGKEEGTPQEDNPPRGRERAEMSVYQPPSRSRDAIQDYPAGGDWSDHNTRSDRDWNNWAAPNRSERESRRAPNINGNDDEYGVNDYNPTADLDTFDNPYMENFGVAKKPEWDGDSAKMEEAFPALGGLGAAARPQGAWGTGNTTAHLRMQAEAQQRAVAVAAASRQSPEELELKVGLRVPGDDMPDSEKRKQMRSKKDFVMMEDVRGRQVNITQGLELHKNLLTPGEQGVLVNQIEQWVAQGHRGELRGRTFTAPRKSMRGKGRVTVQFGCCYNYAVDREGRPAGILYEELVEPMPPLLTALVRRLMRWGVFKKGFVPDSAIVNIYDVDDCIPPHIDSHDFDRPFCTISLLSEEEIMFGANLRPKGADYPGVFVNDQCRIGLPLGSCLVLNGNGADVAKHCVPPVRHRRMSITLRRMNPDHARHIRTNMEAVNKGLRLVTRQTVDEERENAMFKNSRSNGHKRWADDAV